MTEFCNHLNILADSCKNVVEQMTWLTVKNVSVEQATDQTVNLPFAHINAYTDFDKKIDGNFILAFQNIDTALDLASAIAARLGLELFREVCDDSTDLLNEFMNAVVGRIISGWDSIGLRVKFEAPVFKQNHDCTGPKPSQAYLIIIDIVNNEAVYQIALRVSLSSSIKNNIKNKKILLVEDSNVMRGLIRRILVKEGAIINEASDGEEAIVIHKSFCPDLTLMDINMPKMGGFESISHIRKFHPDSKYIILSSSSREDEILSAKNLNVLGYLIKPVEPEQLIKRVSEVL